MKVRYQLPPDAHARLRMLAKLAAARESVRMQPELEQDASSATAAAAPAEHVDRPTRGMQRES